MIKNKRNNKSLVELGRELYPFQVEVIDEMLSSNAVMKLNACVMGLGKTIQAIFLLNYFMLEHGGTPPKTLIICPASLKFNCIEELNYWYCGEPGYIIRDGKTKSKDIVMAFSKAMPLIISIDLLVANKRIRDLLMVGSYDKIIVDESQGLRRSSTLRFKHFSQVRKRTKEVIFLSGTPKENSGEDSFIYFNTLLELGGMNHLPDDNFLKKVAATIGLWKEIFCGFQMNKWGGAHRGFRNTKLLEEAWVDQPEQIFFRRDKDVLKDLPPKIYNMRVFDLSLTDIIDEDEEFKVAQEAFTKAQSDGTPAMMMLLRLLGEMKASSPDVINYIKDHLDSGESLILFAWHHSVINLLVTALKDYNPVVYHGKLNQDDKNTNIKEFKSGNTKLIIGNVQSLGTGHNLQVSNHVKFIEYHFLASKNEQAADRIQRIGQTKNCFVEYISTNTDFEKKHINNMLQKHKIIEKTIDNISQKIHNNKKRV